MPLLWWSLPLAPERFNGQAGPTDPVLVTVLSRMVLLLSLLHSRHPCLGISSFGLPSVPSSFPWSPGRIFPSSPPQTSPPGEVFPKPPHVKLKLPPLPSTFSFLSFSTALIPLNTVCSVFHCLTYSLSPLEFKLSEGRGVCLLFDALSSVPITTGTNKKQLHEWINQCQ